MATDLDRPEAEQGNRIQERYDREFNNIVENYGNTAEDPRYKSPKTPNKVNPPPSIANSSPSGMSAGDIRDKETNPSTAWKDSTSLGETDKKGFVSRIRGARKKQLAILGGVAGAGGLVGLIFMMLLPLRAEMFISNIMAQATKVPAYAVEQRGQYLITRAIATRILMMSDANVDGNLVFCKNAAIGCSLFKTYTTKFIEDRYNLKLNKTVHGIEITVKTEGRTSLGGKANKWVIEGTRTGTESERVTRIVREMDNKQMNLYLKNVVRDRMPNHNIVTRYLSRKILMKKYGVTHWRAFTRTQAKIDDVRTTIRAKTIANTYGKIAPRFGIYMACLQQTDTCSKTIRLLNPSGIDITALEDAVKNAKTEEERKAAQKALDRAKASIKTMEKLGLTNIGEDLDKAGDKQISKFFSQKMLARAGGIMALAGVLDLMFGAVESVDDGALDEIAQDMAATAYVGYAFGDDTGLVTNRDKLKDGSIDSESYGIIDATLDGAQDSPLMRAENGIESPSVGSKSVAECPTEDGTKAIELPENQLVCDNQKLNRNYTAMFASRAGWNTLVPIAKGWNRSVGVAFDILGSAMGAIINIIPGLSKLFDFVGEKMSPLGEWFMGMIFDPPDVGASASGASNYVALSGAIRLSQNDLMKFGTDEQGKAFGAGGRVLSTSDIGAIIHESNSNSPQPSVLARIFSPEEKGSITQQIALTAPTDAATALSSILKLPTLSQFSNVNSASAADLSLANPFGMAIYGYTSSDGVFEADPNNYTLESCDKMSTDREESLGKIEGYPMEVYTKSDPCALEKMVVGTLLVDAGNTSDPQSLENLDENTGTSDPGSDNPLPDGSIADLAKIILESKYITIVDYSGNPAADRADRSLASQQLEDMAAGKLPNISRRCGYPNKTANPDIKLMQFLADVAQNGPSTKLNVLFGQCHSATSNHPIGRAVDFGCPSDVPALDKIGAKYGVKHNFENCDKNSHWHYSVGGG